MDSIATSLTEVRYDTAGKILSLGVDEFNAAIILDLLTTYADYGLKLDRNSADALKGNLDDIRNIKSSAIAEIQKTLDENK